MCVFVRVFVTVILTDRASTMHSDIIRGYPSGVCDLLDRRTKERDSQEIEAKGSLK